MGNFDVSPYSKRVTWALGTHSELQADGHLCSLFAPSVDGQQVVDTGTAQRCVARALPVMVLSMLYLQNQFKFLSETCFLVEYGLKVTQQAA